MKTANTPTSPSLRLVVFSDDWGRHPSSCQHLVGQLLARYPTVWVNTVGTRPPRLSWEDVGKAAAKLVQWMRPPRRSVTPSVALPVGPDGRSPLENLTVVTPKMYPGFRRPWQRRLNAKWIARSVNRALGSRCEGERRVAITTVPITADLPGLLDVDAWVYYCVDDFSVWPGLDGRVMDEMDRQLATRCDAVICVSETLRRRVAAWGCDSTLLTHGIELAHWTAAAASPARAERRDTGGTGGDGGDGHSNILENVGMSRTLRALEPAASELPDWWRRIDSPILLFWGVVDQRLDTDWCAALAEQCGTLVLLGPQQSPHEALSRHDRIIMPGPMPYDLLPALAQAADVLVMPYADLPVTRAIQPLKFKEYLATGKPVMSRLLPATADWADAADVLDDLDETVRTVKQRIADGGIPDGQREARRRLMDESWTAKAAQLEAVVQAVSQPASTSEAAAPAVAAS